MLTPHLRALAGGEMQGRNTTQRENSFTSVPRVVKSDTYIKPQHQGAHIRQ
jgi:hypothetical protein